MVNLFDIFLWNFYIVDRNISTFEHVEEVPHFVKQMIPMFFIMIFSEYLILLFKKKKTKIRINDGITSLSLGMLMEMTKLFTKGIQLIGYQWLYEHRFLDLDWKLPYTWWIAAIGVDFCYYWIHRAVHEISLFWCGHQVHHSSEEYNLTTALRQSAFQHLFSIGFYQPLALIGVPLPALLVHIEFNLLYQFWIHTELVSNLGPLEWIFNTASHHRVHHGINKWCLDKNYAGFLIIWDRMFGTFQEERKDEKIIYGIITQPQTFNPLYLQVYYFKDTVQKAWSMTSWSATFKALFCGPGWAPGTPRLGDENAIPDKTLERVKHNPRSSVWLNCYVILHFVITLFAHQKFMITYAVFNWFTALVFMAFIFLSLFTFGCIFDGRWWAPLVETARCISTVAILRNGFITLSGNLIIDNVITGYFAVSTLVWSSHCLNMLTSQKSKVL